MTVVYNGRGIPSALHPEQKRPALEVVMTMLHAGGKFRQEELQGLGRFARRRRLGRQRAVRVADRRGAARRRGVEAELPARRADDRGPKVGRARDRHDGDVLPDRRSSRPRFQLRHLSQRLRELAFLNNGVRIDIEDHAARDASTSSGTRAASDS